MSYKSKKSLLSEYNAKLEKLGQTPLDTPEYKALKQRLEEIDFSLELSEESDEE
jgi:hypothetical protein